MRVGRKSVAHPVDFGQGINAVIAFLVADNEIQHPNIVLKGEIT
jgi:hypothetical protein